jgi:hypothetical protein
MSAGRRFWGIVAIAIGAIAVIAIGVALRENARADAERREKLRVVTTVSTLAMDCPDDRRPFYVTIRNLAERTVREATIQLAQDPMPAGTLPSDMPTVSLKAPLPRGQSVSECYALNRMRLFAHGIDPRSIHWLALPVHVVFE